MKILSNKNVLVLGASGQLGSELQRHLGSIPSHVTYLRKSLWGKGFKNKRICKFISLDLLKANNETIKKLILHVDIIIHLAAVKLLVEMYEIKFNKKIKINKNLDTNHITDTRSYKLKPSQLFLKSFKYKFDMKKGFSELLKGEI